MKKIYIGSNLKMYKGINDTCAYLEELGNLIKDIDRKDMEVFILPSYLSLEAAKRLGDKYNILIGVQNMCPEDEGQFTGEVSPEMLKEIGINMIMAGHSERRHIFKENDFDENQKILSAISHGFRALLCVGETAEDKTFNIGREILRKQILIGLNGIKDISSIMIAYEPVWSIGVNGIPASSDYADKMHFEIKSCLYEIFGEDGYKIPVLYGGSVNEDNAVELFRQKNIDGLFIGRAAWQAKRFDSIIRKIIDIK